MPEVKTEVVFRRTATFADDERKEFRLNRATTLVLSRAVLETWSGGWTFTLYGYRKEHWKHDREAREYTYRSRRGTLPESLHELFLELNKARA